MSNSQISRQIGFDPSRFKSSQLPTHPTDEDICRISGDVLATSIILEWFLAVQSPDLKEKLLAHVEYSIKQLLDAAQAKGLADHPTIVAAFDCLKRIQEALHENEEYGTDETTLS